MSLVATIERLFAEHGARAYEGARRESVSALEHALQSAQLAEWAHADAPLVAAALLHDIGHFVAADAEANQIDDVHELRAVPFLAQGFSANVVEPVRLHVKAVARISAKTGVEMEALTAVSVAALTVYDMCKAVDKTMTIDGIRLVKKTGGTKSST